MAKEFRVSEFRDRLALDETLLGLKSDEKDTSLVVGTAEEFKRFHLGATTRVHGVPCKIIDAPKDEEPMAPKIDRGPRREYGIAGRERPKKVPEKKKALKAKKKK